MKKYTVSDSIYSPFIFKSPIYDKYYVMPGWIECDKNATLDDVNYIPYNSKKDIKEKIIKKFKSSSDPNIEYNVKLFAGELQCDCPGYLYRGRNCKHVKEVKIQMK